MSDHLKRFLSIGLAVFNGFMSFLFFMTGFYIIDEDFPIFMGIGAAFLLNAVFNGLYAKSVKQDIEMKEMLEEENRRMRSLRRTEYQTVGKELTDEEEEDLQEILTRPSQNGTERKTI